MGEGEAKAEHRFHEVIRSVLRPLYDGSSVFYRFSAHLNEEPGVRQQVRRTYEVNRGGAYLLLSLFAGALFVLFFLS